jgi:hypothetical protein
MKRHLSFCLIISLIISFSTSAQNEKIHFRSINLTGIVGGESQVNSVFQTINGINFSNWYSGIGIGIDDYRYKTLPLFFDARISFGNESKGFVYVDLGYNFPLENKPGKEMGYYNTSNFKGGLYTDFGIGFKTKFIKNSSLLFSLGHSYKQVQSKIGIAPLCIGCQSYFYDYKFGYGRIVLKAGVEF